MQISRIAVRLPPRRSFCRHKSLSRMSIQQGLPTSALKDFGGHESRCVGSLLGCFCGDALGAPVEGQTWQDIAQQGLHFGQMQHGHYTDDTQMTSALAQSLVRTEKSNAADAAKAYATAFDDRRGYGGSACETLRALRNGTVEYRSSGTRGFPEGSFANGGAMRIAPVGLAYRNADSSMLQQAVQDALLCTHVHPEGIEGAFIQAAAVAALCRTTSDEAGPASSPKALLLHLQKVSRVPTMQDKLQVLSDSLPDAPPPLSASCIDESNWEGNVNSEAWQYDCQVLKRAGVAAFQIRAMDAAVAALWAVCRHWQEPKAAIIAAVRGGGDTDTIAAMAGALSGALHGTDWIPQQWFEKLENGPEGRDAVVTLALQLARLDIR